MTHLRPQQKVDAAEGILDEAARQHLENCAACRRDVEGLATMLAEVAEEGVPEPSPLFWDHLTARVRSAVAREPDPTPGWRERLGWPAMIGASVLAAIATVAVVWTMAVSGARQHPASEARATQEPVALATDVQLAVEEWHVVADLMGPMDWDTASVAGLGVEPGDAELAALALTEDEQQELLRLLTAELNRTKS